MALKMQNIFSLSSKFQNLKTLGPTGSLCVEEIGGVFRGQHQHAGFRIVDSHFGLKRVLQSSLKQKMQMSQMLMLSIMCGINWDVSLDC